MGGGLESRCVGRVYGADGAVHHPHRTTNSNYSFYHVESPVSTQGRSFGSAMSCIIVAVFLFYLRKNMLQIFQISLH